MMDSHIGGIPCLIEIIFWSPADLDDKYECDWVVRDRRGRPAPWLRAKMTKADEHRIEREVFRHMTRGNRNDD